MIDKEQLTDIQISGIDIKDYPEFTDAYISRAELNGKRLTRRELDEINEDYEFVNECTLKQLQG